MAGSPAFRLFGFPVHVRVGFLVFLALVVAVNADVDATFGVWVAVFMAALTLLHELGHAFAARATGAKAEIALDFFYGYAAFVPTRPLKRWERAGISLAGPATQILLACAVLALMGVNPLDIDDVRNASSMAKALWWAGPLIGIFNLIPVLPFDGGNILMAGIDVFLPGRSRVVMIWFSLVLTSLAAVWLLASGSQSFAIFIFIPLFAQIQMLRSQMESRRRRTVPAAASLFAAAEAVAWQSGADHQFAGGQVSSPWFRAHRLYAAGEPERAGDVLVDDFAGTTTPTWWPPDTAPPASLRELVALLPRPLPTGHPYSEYVLSGVLVRIGEHREAAHYAADSYARHRSPMLAVNVARAAAALGDRDTALAWLRTAVTSQPASDTLRHAVQVAPEFDRLRHDPQFVVLMDDAA